MVPTLSCSGDKHSFTVIPAVKANREKLLLKVAFKGVHQLQNPNTTKNAGLGTQEMLDE